MRVVPPFTERVCRYCQRVTPKALLAVNNKGKPTFECKECEKARKQAWSERNRIRVRSAQLAYSARYPERVAESKRKNIDANKQKYAAASSLRKKNNRDAVNAYNREQYAIKKKLWKERQQKYCANNPERVKALLAASSSKRRRHVENSPSHFTADDVMLLYKTQDGVCASPVCHADLARGYHVDHVMPLCLGGTNGPENIQLLCPSCNLQKNRKHPAEWARMNGFEYSQCA